MGKRSNFARRKQDAYMTPPKPIRPLLRHLPWSYTYCEPCAGDGRMSAVLGPWTAAYDIEPKAEGIVQKDALDLTLEDLNGADFIITNPPWTRSILHPMIQNFCHLKPTWLLFDADWAHTGQAAPLMRYCDRIVSVGRVSWMENGVSGKDNAAWYRFNAYSNHHRPEFFWKEDLSDAA